MLPDHGLVWYYRTTLGESIKGVLTDRFDREEEPLAGGVRSALRQAFVPQSCS